MSTTFDARIKNKRDTASNWETSNPVLLNGEIILVDTAAGDLRTKIGDGVKTYTQLPFTDEKINLALANKAEKTEAPLRIVISETISNGEVVLMANYKASEINSLVSSTGQLIYMFVPIYGHVIQATFLYYQDSVAYFSFVAYDGIFSVTIDENKNVQVARTYAYPTALSNLTDDIGIANMNAALANKYDKTGGEISGNVKIDGNLTLDIDDEDYDSGITFTKALDTNLGTVLTLTGYANGVENTNYRVVLRNIHDPVNNYDAATKKYVDEHSIGPQTYLVFLNNDGTIATGGVSSGLTYNTVKAKLTALYTDIYLDVIYQTSRFFVKAHQDMDTNNGPIKFFGTYLAPEDGQLRVIEFTLNTQDQLTVRHYQMEHWWYKVQTVVGNSTNTLTYPSTKAIFDEFQRKPVTIWETTTGNGLTASDQDISTSMTWQLTGLDFSPYKRVKIYTKAGLKTSGVGQDASNTPAVVLEMSLDSRAASPTGGHYLGSIVGQKPNDSNRLFTVTCAISADKTSFSVLRMSSIYGTAATGNSDVNGYVFKIEGYYD